MPDTEGETVSLADFVGQRLLLIFSSTTCPACKRAYLELKSFSEMHADVQVVMVSRGTAEENWQVKEEQGFPFPVLVAQSEIIQTYQVPGTPFFYVIDEQGTIASSGFASTVEGLEKVVCAGDACKH